MSFILIPTGALVIASLLLVTLYRGVRRLVGRPTRTSWRRTLIVVALLVPVHLFVVAPLFFGFLGSRVLGTRPDEDHYAGPWLDGKGRWWAQDRRDPESGVATPPEGVTVLLPLTLTTADDVRVNAFLIPALVPREPPVTALVVHGLFRGALEVEPVARLFRDLGAEVMVLELRNHGGSGRAPASFGLREREDVLAAARFLRARPGDAERDLVVFGVSMGTAAVALAARDIPGLSGLVLDAPTDALLPTAHRVLGTRAGIPQPFRSLILEALELWSGLRFAEIRPIDALARSRAVPALVVGGGIDERMPPEVVRRVFDALPAAPEDKELWIRDGSDHGKVWLDDPEGYRIRLLTLLDRVRAARDR